MVASGAGQRLTVSYDRGNGSSGIVVSGEW